MALAVVAAATAAATTAAPVAAHVALTPPEAAGGSMATVTFTVPNERADASTVEVVIALPSEHPVETLEVHQTAGWSHAVDRHRSSQSTNGRTTEESADTVTWSGGRLSGRERAEFTLTLGPLPTDTDRMVFRALQTYDDGEVVRWIEDPAAGGDHPAVALRVTGGATPTTAAGGTGRDSTTTTGPGHDGGDGGAGAAEAAARSDGDGGGPAGVVLAVAVAAAATAVALIVFRRLRPRPAAAAGTAAPDAAPPDPADPSGR